MGFLNILLTASSTPPRFRLRQAVLEIGGNRRAGQGRGGLMAEGWGVETTSCALVAAGARPTNHPTRAAARPGPVEDSVESLLRQA